MESRQAKAHTTYIHAYMCKKIYTRVCMRYAYTHTNTHTHTHARTHAPRHHGITLYHSCARAGGLTASCKKKKKKEE
jgi:hypothetical protein